MKKKLSILLFIIMFLSFLIMQNNFAKADGNTDLILRVEKDDIYFYYRPDFKEESKLFLTTKTYFLKGNDLGDYYSVEYKKSTNAEIFGYVKKSDVKIYDEGIPSVLYPEFKAKTDKALLTLYEIGTLQPKFSENFPENTYFNCYGKLVKDNKTYMLINYEGQTNYSGPYYVNYNDLTVEEPKEHPIPLKVISNNPEPDPVTPDDNTKKSSNSNEIIQILIILAIIIFAIVIVYFMFKPGGYKYKKNDDN